MTDKDEDRNTTWDLWGHSRQEANGRDDRLVGRKINDCNVHYVDMIVRISFVILTHDEEVEWL